MFNTPPASRQQSIMAPIPRQQPVPPRYAQPANPLIQSKFYPELAHIPQPPQNYRQQNVNPHSFQQYPQRNLHRYQSRNPYNPPQTPYNQQQYYTPPRPPKPPQPMDVDESVRTRAVNYVNRPKPQKIVENISPGIILLNQYKSTIEIDSQKIDLEGSYAVQFHNSTVIIDNQKYPSIEILTGKPLPAILQSNIPSKEILSLKMMKELHINNTKRLAALETTHTAALIKNFSLTITSIIFISDLIIKLMMKINFKAEPKLSSYNVNANKADTQKVTTETLYSTEATSPVF
ncbi:unnamed protein product [Ceratitis capitata]|uniref:(Mediterranean fruit fly) hypothetical protein n=1 Tax=Ceratitis capitata TaxID=7213 RepID=A0A811V037_CERCA|nr:unnamed protein product [Ceratitis capitata]